MLKLLVLHSNANSLVKLGCIFVPVDLNKFKCLVYLF